MGAFMLDTTNVDDIPADTPSSTVLAGYVDGQWQSFLPITARFPDNPHVSIAVFQGSKAMVGDCETGDMTPDSAAQDLKDGNIEVIYMNESTWPLVEEAVAILGLPTQKYWVASWLNALPPEPPTIPESWVLRGCVAWQYANPAITGSNLDYSVTWGSWPTPLPTGVVMASAIEVIRNADGSIATIFTESNEGHLQQWVPPNASGDNAWHCYDISSYVPTAAPLAP